MDSDDFFFDEPDSAILAHIDAIEAADSASQSNLVSHNRPVSAGPSVPPPRRSPPARSATVINLADSDSFDVSGSFDDADFNALDGAAANVYNGGPPSAFRAYGVGQNAILPTVQRDLHGNVATANRSPAATTSRHQPQSLRTSSARGGFGGPQRKTKYWDHTTFAKSGWKKTRDSKGKGKAKKPVKDEDDEDDENMESLPMPFIPSESYHCRIQTPTDKSASGVSRIRTMIHSAYISQVSLLYAIRQTCRLSSIIFARLTH